MDEYLLQSINMHCCSNVFAARDDIFKYCFIFQDLSVPLHPVVPYLLLVCKIVQSIPVRHMSL